MSLEYVLASTGLSVSELAYCLAAVFIAGLVRGFSGFALSALIVASMVRIIPPVELLPMNYLLELVAGAATIKHGLRDADLRIGKYLVIGSAIGLPIGLWWLTHLPADTTKLIALGLILVLSITLLARVKPKGLDRSGAVFGAGIVSGIVSGIAGVGGMVIVIFNFAVGLPARTVRGTVVFYLVASTVFSLVFYLAYSLFTLQSFARFGVLVVPAMLGVIIGTRLFSPGAEKYYRVFCLGLLILLSVVGIVGLVGGNG